MCLLPSQRSSPNAIKRILTLMALLMVFAQWGTLQHDLEHESHTFHATCEAFNAYAASGAACINTVLSTLCPSAPVEPLFSFVAHLVEGAFLRSSIRGPPQS